MDALIGYSGFVGSVLASQHDFSAQFNSSNIGDAANRDFDVVVCAAAPGSMLEANKLPERDYDRIQSLQQSLSTINAKTFVLISTVAVLEGFSSPQAEESQDFRKDLPYGRNRRALEEFCASTFSDCLIVRLPALYAPGLKKNFLFDILNPVPTFLPEAKLKSIADALPDNLSNGFLSLYSANSTVGLSEVNRTALAGSAFRAPLEAALLQQNLSALQFTNTESRFQFYDLSTLWSDIQLALSNKLRIVHLAPEPITAGDVYLAATGNTMPNNSANLHREDLRTQYSALWNASSPYIASATETLKSVTAFLQRERAHT